MKKSKEQIDKIRINRLVKILWIWRCRASRAANAHYFASDYYSKRNHGWTSFNVLSAIVVLFLTANNTLFSSEIGKWLGGDGTLHILTSIAGLAVVLTTTAQHIFKYSEISSLHKFSGSEFSNIKRKIERIIASGEVDENAIHRISNTLNWLGKCSPPLKRKMWDESKKIFRKGFDDLDAAERAFLDSLGTEYSDMVNWEYEPEE